MLSISARVVERLGFGPTRVSLAELGDRVAPAGLLDQSTLDVEMIESSVGLQVERGGQASRNQFEKFLAAQNSALIDRWLQQMVASGSSFIEMMTWFWHGYFATASSKVRSPNLLATQNNTQRRLALGSFGDLAQAMAVDPAMLIWLDGQENRKGAPNENFGRELMELFLLGVGNYSERDVKEAARALTGWTVDKKAGSATFTASRAEPGTKVVLGERVADVRSLTSMLVARPESARFVVGRVWARFVASTPPPPAAVERLAAAFGPRRDVRALMRAVIDEPAFADPASVLVKQPVEWAVGLMRILDVQPLRLSDEERGGFRSGLKVLGQLPFDPPSVGGWPTGESWLTTGAALGRLSLARLVARNADLSPVAQTAPSGRAEAAWELVGLKDPSDRTRLAIAAGGDNPEVLVALAACAPEYVVSR